MSSQWRRYLDEFPDDTWWFDNCRRVLARTGWTVTTRRVPDLGFFHLHFELPSSTVEHWCHTCPGVPHRVEHPGQLCPSCEGTEEPL